MLLTGSVWAHSPGADIDSVLFGSCTKSGLALLPRGIPTEGEQTWLFLPSNSAAPLRSLPLRGGPSGLPHETVMAVGPAFPVNFSALSCSPGIGWRRPPFPHPLPPFSYFFNGSLSYFRLCPLRAQVKNNHTLNTQLSLSVSYVHSGGKSSLDSFENSKGIPSRPAQLHHGRWWSLTKWPPFSVVRPPSPPSRVFLANQNKP